jgi:hypothetical protein
MILSTNNFGQYFAAELKPFRIPSNSGSTPGFRPTDKSCEAEDVVVDEEEKEEEEEDGEDEAMGDSLSPRE